ncbi:hypothetical protein MKW98_010649 [Papaver atlanticum]|uniref:Uncharacterized protein n=1 Tax=Papaver atlanticum TaxID=357466 RepID=A0AAD4XEM1_9MAGN|nr:hypothetical protein MKW98_010649 [Papaver atlanticum]
MYIYDQYGEDALKEGTGGGGGGGRNPFDIFESVFGGGGDGGRSRERMCSTVKGQTVGHQVDVPAAKVQE